MARRFAEIAFTPDVIAAQKRYGSLEHNRRIAESDDPGPPIGGKEAAFIAERDGFYQASVGEIGWPYVQFRGGPKGFLKVIDERTLAYPDFRGNTQYLSVGNLSGDDRVSLILMDYAAQRRLKVWARTRIVHKQDDPALFEQLALPGYRALVERALILGVEAVDWNCPQHFTPRYTETQIAELVAPLRARIAELEALALRN